MKLLRLALADQHAPGALHVPRGERLAVMPFHALSQLERQPGVGGIPGPAFREIRDYGIQALMDLEWIEHHEVVEDSRKRRHRSDGGFLEQRRAGRIVVVIEPKGAALFLCGRGTSEGESDAHQRDHVSR